ncbi:Endo-1,4-beta-xylanase A precursor [Enhygromyxa salina]|uniref:Endo-1,4-beta-xylanase A n=1 Tax=Enhygromyxa salina TaxID=215803 RepID=A0A0C2CTD9_9BACT|nr:choice-of-anchor L domain-containing protein [Enhygromyxa salina]KIG14431.1 Endo-1,4-beta-xylanase A precursor [Enhygromyxa salina]
MQLEFSQLKSSLRQTILTPLWACLVLAPLGCSDDTSGRDTETGVNTANNTSNNDTTGDGDGDGDSGDGDTGDGDTGDGDPTEDTGPIPEPKWDVGTMPDSPDICLVPNHQPCDHLDFPSEEQRAWRALGLNCPGEFQAILDYNGHYDALEVLVEDLGTHNPPTYPILEGVKMVALSTGNALDILMPGSDGDTTLPGNDPGALPAPMNPNAVAGDCVQDPGLVGTGDCSGTIGPQFINTAGAFDYAEMRFSIDVPEAVNGFAYNVAFMSWEYPNFYGWAYNDIYIAWLESEEWTGNITFDDFGAPLSLNAGFLDFKDAPNDIDCPLPCSAPELDGTGVEGHAGTRWLETNTGVTAGENITVIFAIMDIQDNIVDSVVLLDNFRWTCIGGTPGTVVG